MSDGALRGLRAAVEYNSEAAQFLRDALRGLPIGVRYKPQDRYGPLGMMILAFAPTVQITDKVSIFQRNGSRIARRSMRSGWSDASRSKSWRTPLRAS